MREWSLEDYANDVLDARPDLLSTRQYNHWIVEQVHSVVGVHRRRMIDIGCSAYGFAMEQALRLGVGEYWGVDPSIREEHRVTMNSSRGHLLPASAYSLPFPDRSFDIAVTISTMEHFSDPPRALAEIRRVLKPGGHALIVCEPIWTSARGHHVHQWADIVPLVGPWEHLRYTEEDFRRIHSGWPACSKSLNEICAWIYHSPEINRMGAAQLRTTLKDGGFDFRWFIEYPEDGALASLAPEVSRTCGIPGSDLLVRGFSVFGSK